MKKRKIWIVLGSVEKELLLRAAEIIDYISIEDDEASEEAEYEIDENRWFLYYPL